MVQDNWTEHAVTFLEMAFRSDRQRRMDHPSGSGGHRGACGDSIEIFLRIDGDQVLEMTYEVSGCMNTNACANALAELAEGKTVEDAWRITPEAVAAFLQSLPPDHLHCAELVVGAFYRALASYGQQRGNAWKQSYLNRLA